MFQGEVQRIQAAGQAVIATHSQMTEPKQGIKLRVHAASFFCRRLSIQCLLFDQPVFPKAFAVTNPFFQAHCDTLPFGQQTTPGREQDFSSVIDLVAPLALVLISLAWSMSVTAPN